MIFRMTILIAEDDDFAVLMLKKMLRNLASEIIVAKNGHEAVEKFRLRPDIQLVLMDILMPEMDGYEATRNIREQNKHVVIIVQTALVQPSDREKAFNAGCTDFINKPLNRDTLTRLIRNHINQD
ncbi:MAG TPA: response regulator [Bacteroidales bacterium]|nr:response regulator [Bacteroidales bacterium]